MLFPRRFFAEILGVDRQDSTRVGQYCVSRLFMGPFDLAWQKILQVFRRDRLANLKQGVETRLNRFQASLGFVGETRAWGV